jgi:DNA-binding NarL/FixJ family response regulator
MSRAVARLVLRQICADNQPVPPADDRPTLTDRQRQVVEQLARGLSYAQVAVVLNISANTVRTYVRIIYDKLFVCSKTEAVMAALRFGLIASASTT